MQSRTEQQVTVAEARQDLSRLIHLADENGEVFVLRDDKPVYKLVNLEVMPDPELTDDEKIDVIAKRILKRYKPAFLELAK